MSLPIPLTGFVGREREVETVVRSLDTSRLVTLTGAGGSGKTRLAIAVAQQLAVGFRTDTAWVDLSPLADPTLLASHVSARLGVREEADREPLETLRASLRERELLLVLDNCEHLVDACARLVETLLKECSSLRILATSREALAVAGEIAWLVPLLGTDEATTLFVERARAVLPSFALTSTTAPAVAAICRRLDGLPLAIELAAARSSVLAPAQLLARLDEGLRFLGAGSRTAPPRQRTMRGAIDWSYALLEHSERLLLARLAVFRGTFSLTAVERVCSDHRLPTEDILDLLAALVEKSLVMMEVRAGEARYRLLEVVARYAEELLAASADDSAIRERHAAFFLALAEESEEHMLGYGAPQWASTLDDEMPNLRAAFDWCIADPEHEEEALRLGRVLYWFWRATGQFAEGRARLEAALARSERASPRARARAMTALGFLTLCQGDRSAIRSPMAESVELLRRLDDPAALASALLCLGMADLLEGHVAQAGPVLAEAVASARATGHPALVAQTLYWSGNASRAAGDLDGARVALAEAVALARRPGLEYACGYCAARLGLLHHLAGDQAAALAALGDALALQRTAPDRWGVVQVLDGLAGVAAALGHGERAARLLGAAEGLSRQMDATAPMDLREFHDHFAASARVVAGEATFLEALAAGHTLDVEKALAEAAETMALLLPGAGAATPRRTAESPALRVLSLGPLEIHRDGTLVPPTAWRAARPRELLLYLLCHPAGRTRDQIALVFWPDASPAQVKNNFHVTLHYLRKAIGRADLIVFDRERYRVNWDLRVELDAATFADEMRALLRLGAAELPVDRMRSALALYRGDFLEDSGAGDWHLEHRDHLRRMHDEAVLTLAASEELHERFVEAGEAYRRLISRDPLDEAAARGLIRCLAREGRRVEALRELERLTHALRTELNAEPSADTRALAERIRLAEPLGASLPAVTTPRAH